MANTYTSREARRKAAIADALMQSALAPSQGQMVGRYYVGEGIGGGITRLGQALLGRSLSGKADTLEDESLAEQKQVKKAAYDQFNAAVTPHDVTTMEYPGSGPMFGATPKTSKYTPNNKDIAAALMKYQSDTGEKVDDSVVKLLAGGALGGADALKYQFGGGVITQDENGKPGFSIPVQNPQSGEVTAKFVPIGTVVSRNTGLNANEQSVLDIRTEGGKAAARIAAENGLADDSAAAAAKVAAAKAGAQVVATEKSEKAVSAVNANDALYELGKIEAALPNLPATPVGMSWENFKAQYTGGDPKVQAAVGAIEQASGRMLKYVERLPGAATDADRQVFMASAGVINDPKATVQRKVAAIQAAKESYQRLIERYGDNGAQPAKPANQAAGWSYLGAKP